MHVSPARYLRTLAGRPAPPPAEAAGFDIIEALSTSMAGMPTTDLEKLRTALRRSSCGGLLTIAERGAEPVLRAKLGALERS